MTRKWKIALSVLAALLVIGAAVGVWAYRYCTSPAYKARRLVAEMRAYAAPIGGLATSPAGSTPFSSITGFVRRLTAPQPRYTHRTMQRFMRDLVALGPAAAPALLVALSDSKSEAAAIFAQCLSKISSPDIVDPLFGFLAGNDQQMRWLATISLAGNVGIPRVRDKLFACLSDANYSVAFSAAWALGKSKNPEAIATAVRLIESDDPQTRRMAGVVLGHAGDPRAIKPLGELLGNKQGLKFARTTAARLLGQIEDPAAADVLAGLVHRDDPIRRRYVILALGRTRDLRAIEPLVEVVEDQRSSDWTRKQAIRLLEDFDDPRAAKAIKRVAESDPNPHMRAFAGASTPRMAASTQPSR